MTGLLLFVVAMAGYVAGAWRGGAVRAADRNALLEADMAFSNVTSAKRLTGFMSFLAEGVGTLNSEGKVLVGREVKEKRWAGLLNDPAMTIQWKPTQAEITATGDFGFTMGRYQTRRRDEKGAGLVASGKYVTFWKKQADGSWKVVFDAGVQDPAPASAK
jgi:ketosteroid isomerase-like protein